MSETVVKTCPDCKKEFDAPKKSRFPRKYCDTCSKERKKAWDDQWMMKAEDMDDA